MDYSVIIPAYNEQSLLPGTLRELAKAIEYLLEITGSTVEVIVVDNGSTDYTATIAQALGAKVVLCPTRGIAVARNTGTHHSSGTHLIFVDADTIVPIDTLRAIDISFKHDRVVGGAVATDYRPKNKIIKLYLMLWARIAFMRSMAQGVTQFCTREAFDAIGGYDESMYMSEDVDFYWRLQKYAKQRNASVTIIMNPKVIPSTRRFDQWPIWKTLLWTNPLIVKVFLKSQRFWAHWYDRPPR